MIARADRYRAVVVGSSAGGLNAMTVILRALGPGFPLPIVWVQHVPSGSSLNLSRITGLVGGLAAVEVDDKMPAEANCLYIAPPDYHVLIEADLTLSLAIDAPELWSRPSINVLFESASASLGSGAIAVLLTGANSDGARGIEAIKRHGGVTIVQDPASAEIAMMPRSAILTGSVDHVLPLAEIADLLRRLASDSLETPARMAQKGIETRSNALGEKNGKVQSPAR